MIRTFAPLAMHWSACVFCFCGSPCALTTRAETPAALNALMSDGWSNSSRRIFTTLPHPGPYVKGCMTIRRTSGSQVRLAAGEDVTRYLGLRRDGDPIQPGGVQAGVVRSADSGEGADGRRRARRPDGRLR